MSIFLGKIFFLKLTTKKEPFPKDMSDAGTYPGSPVTSAVHTTFDTPSVSTPAAQILHRYTGSAEI
jgi:hypothetical protein